MKKIFMFTATTLAFFLIIVAIFWLLPQKDDNDYASLNEKPQTTNSENTSHVCAKEEEKGKKIKENTLYCIKEYKGNIAVFENSKEKPFRITNIAVDELPTEDQKLLKQGIEVSNQEELNNLIEDYCS